jgi:hypothetical protein
MYRIRGMMRGGRGILELVWLRVVFEGGERFQSTSTTGICPMSVI